MAKPDDRRRRLLARHAAWRTQRGMDLPETERDARPDSRNPPESSPRKEAPSEPEAAEPEAAEPEAAEPEAAGGELIPAPAVRPLPVAADSLPVDALPTDFLPVNSFPAGDALAERFAGGTLRPVGTNPGPLPDPLPPRLDRAVHELREDLLTTGGAAAGLADEICARHRDRLREALGLVD